MPTVAGNDAGGTKVRGAGPLTPDPSPPVGARGDERGGARAGKPELREGIREDRGEGRDLEGK